LHDLSPDDGKYPTIFFCKLLAVIRKTEVILSAITLNLKSKVILECGTNPTNGNTGVKVYVADTQNRDRCQL